MATARKKSPHAPGSQWRDLALDAMAQVGMRAGGARTRVVDRLAGQDCCCSAQEIHDSLRSQGASVGIASVYRALEALEGLGLVQRTDLGDGIGMFEAVTPGGDHHHHLVCDRCGRVTPFEDETLERTIHKLASGKSHSLTGHEVVIRGICPSCTGTR